MIQTLPLILLLLMPQITVQGVNVQGVTLDSTGGAIAAPDWTSSFYLIWEAETPSELGDNTGTCGGTPSDCDADTIVSITLETTNVIIGSNSFNGTGSATDYLQATDDGDIIWGTGDVSMGTFAQTAPSHDSINVMGEGPGNSNGMSINCGSDTEDACEFTIGHAITPYTDTVTYPDSLSDTQEWVFMAAVYTDATPSIKGHVKGGSSVNNIGTGTTGSQELQTFATEEFRLGNTANSRVNYFDQAWVIQSALSDAAVCRICSCAIDGSLCTYSGTSWVDDGLRTTDCGSCTLCSDASASTPGSCS